jgi:hypothetical protein
MEVQDRGFDQEEASEDDEAQVQQTPEGRSAQEQAVARSRLRQRTFGDGADV